ncbi:MAG: hypothetical protein RL543_798 [Pseudomonadota bacterium]
MPIDILMPALSPTMEKGNLTKWLKAEGDRVKSGDVIAEIETDKATMEVEAVDEGILAAILVPAGSQDVAVNAVIARITGDGEATGSAKAPASAPVSPSPAPTASPPTPAVVHAEPSVVMSSYDASGEIPAGTEMVMITMREALRDAMAEEMRANDSVFIMGEEVAEYQGAYKITQGLLQEFGDRRVVDTPITEHGFAGIGVGAALTGLRPIIEFMTFNFAMQAIDHIINPPPKPFICPAVKWDVRLCFVARMARLLGSLHSIVRIIRRGIPKSLACSLFRPPMQQMRKAC